MSTENKPAETPTTAAGTAAPAATHKKIFLAFSERARYFFRFLPALLAGLLVLRGAELLAGMEPGTAFGTAALVWLAAAALDLYGLVKLLPLLFLLSLPLLGRKKGSLTGLGIAWSVLLLLQMALVQYYFQSGVPLGADMYAYSLKDIFTTVKGASALSVPLFFGLAAALAACWAALTYLKRRALPGLTAKAAAIALAAALPLLFLAPAQPGSLRSLNEHSLTLALNKPAFFIEETFDYFSPAVKKAVKTEAASGMALGSLSEDYPFLREERTYDALGPFFNRAERTPNFIFFIAEGLGRDFSGPGAGLGSFTPKLDALAAEGLYWENFLANQGRTFGVLPSLFGSLPFGKNGLAELGEKMPKHMTLLSLLKKAGYRVRVYCGFNADFDNDRAFYALNGADSLTDELNFGPGYQKSNSWGYADRELLTRALAGEPQDDKEPSVTVLKTSTMHTPYRFLGQEAYYPVFERHLDALGIQESRKEAYRKHRDIYTSILYFDTELARFIGELKKRPAWRSTVFVLTGDHRLPEIPMSNKLSRYHVPLVILSPLLKAPARIKGVSSHLDVTPSVLAYLSRNYDLQTPRRVTWLGAGLDTHPSFRSVQSFPMMHTKTDLVDFISGYWFLNHKTLYRLGDSLQISQSADPEPLRSMTAKFGAFLAANAVVARTNALMPEETERQVGPYAQEERYKLPEALSDNLAPGLAVREVRAPESARTGALTIEITFGNPGKNPSPKFVPLAVLMTAEAKELTESYGLPQQLDPDGSVTLKLNIKSEKVAPGRYFLAVIPSHPDTGKAVGAGKYRIPVLLTGNKK
jgi:phosphoglycerol transferase MdoB-like AlkP superfamily enzyme